MQRLLDFADAPEVRRLEGLLGGYHQFLAHDLANQLVTIQGFARLIHDQLGDDDPESRALLTRLADLTRRADQQARRFAEFGRLLRESPTGSTVSLSDLAAEAIATVKSAPRNAAVQASGVAFVVVQRMPSVRVSRRLLDLALVELLYNSVAAHATRVRVSFSPEYDLIVHDDGAGLAEPLFSRLGTLGAAGSGLGWYFILQAVASWRGRALIESELGHGTTVSLSLPHHEE